MRSLAIVPTRSAAATPTCTTSSTREICPATTLRTVRRVTLDGGAVAAHDALQTGARLLDVALELVAGLDATALVARLQLLELLLGRLARAERVGQRAGGADHAVTRLERRAHVGERGALGDRAELLGRDARGALLGLGGRARLVGGLRAHAATRRLRRRRARWCWRGAPKACERPACAWQQQASSRRSSWWSCSWWWWCSRPYWLVPPALRFGFYLDLVRTGVPAEHMYVNRSPGRVTAVALSLYHERRAGT